MGSLHSCLRPCRCRWGCHALAGSVPEGPRVPTEGFCSPYSGPYYGDLMVANNYMEYSGMAGAPVTASTWGCWLVVPVISLLLHWMQSRWLLCCCLLQAASDLLDRLLAGELPSAVGKSTTICLRLLWYRTAGACLYSWCHYALLHGIRKWRSVPCAEKGKHLKRLTV